MTPAQIAEAQKLAREWKPQSPSVATCIHFAAGTSGDASRSTIQLIGGSDDPFTASRNQKN
jgi:hypothetical protein